MAGWITRRTPFIPIPSDFVSTYTSMVDIFFWHVDFMRLEGGLPGRRHEGGKEGGREREGTYA